MSAAEDLFGFKTEGARKREVYAKFLEDRVSEALSAPAIRTAIAKIVDERLKAEVEEIVTRRSREVQAAMGPSVNDILKTVALVTGCAISGLLGHHQSFAYARPRLVAYLFIRDLRPDLSYPQIGHLMGGRDHSTIIKGIKNLEKYRRDDPIKSWLDDPRLKALKP